MLRKSLLLCSASLLAIAGCKDSTGPADLTQEDAMVLAAALDATATLDAADLGASYSLNVREFGSASVSAAPVAIDNQFSVTRQCPRGGQITVAGRTTGSGDEVAHDLSLHTVATRTDAACAFDTRHGVLTLSGNPNIAYDGQLNIVANQLSGLQTQTHRGSFTWTRRAASGTCEVDLSSSYNPATQTATVSGTFCGWTVNASHTRS